MSQCTHVNIGITFTCHNLPDFSVWRESEQLVITEIVKSDLLTYRNTTDITVDLIVMVFCIILPFTASHQHIRHEHRSLTSRLFMHLPLPFSVGCFPSVLDLGTFHFGSRKHCTRYTCTSKITGECQDSVMALSQKELWFDGCPPNVPWFCLGLYHWLFDLAWLWWRLELSYIRRNPYIVEYALHAIFFFLLLLFW